MSFRRRLLIALALIVLVTVGGVSTVVSLRTRRAFEGADVERSDALVAQFRREFTRRGDEVVRRVEAIAAGDTVSRMALDLSHGSDTSAYVTEAKAVADSHQLDLLEFVASDGTIISSAQWPARFGYKEDIAPDLPSKGAVLRLVPLPDDATLGLVAARTVSIGDKPLFVLGGQRLDREFISSLTLPAGMRALLYRNLQPGFSAQSLIGPAGAVDNADRLVPLITRVQQHKHDADEVVQWSADTADSESFHAIPLKGENDALLGVLLIGSSRRGLIELQRHIGAFALIVGGIGILLAILLSGWVAARVTQPIERLAEAAREVAAGHWETQVEVASHDEIGQLAESFNSMTHQLVEQHDRAMQAERVAAWRELARRLAHELKNPLFPLQITVENLLRSRNSTEFDEVFRESTATLLAELGNLKAIVGRFSDFSKMPQPQLQPVNLNEIIRQVLKLHEAQLRVGQSHGSETRATQDLPRVVIAVELDESLDTVAADPDLLHRALSNLVLNALDAMPEGGTITVRTSTTPEHVRIEVSDTGSGLTREECERLFTPYYTTKRHGTGLGLAIVQSVVSDHRGSISVNSTPGKGATFRIDLPRASSAPAASNDMFKSATIT
ncbi:MAG: HAMP domain-containing protein [Acidobacteriia bacterium]|nr:HAMP domain-containing protein [Terriglobia bacterium]